MVSSFVVIALAAASASAQTIAGKCTGQSCYIADLSTSTETPYKIQGGAKPTGGNTKGDTCVKSYYQKFGLPPPEGLRRFARNTGGNFPQDDAETIKEYLQEKKRELVEGLPNRVQGAECKPNALVWAKGTVEPGKHSLIEPQPLPY